MNRQMSNKTNTLKWIFGVVILIAIIAAISVVILKTGITGKVTGGSVKDTIKIGVILPLSGNAASFGEASRNAIELAYSQLNNTKYEYRLIFEDDGFETKRTATAINKLVNIDHVDAVISFASHEGHVIAPIAEQNKIVHMSIASDTTVADGRFTFIHWTQPEDEASLWIQEAKNREYKRIAILTGIQDGLLAMEREVEKNAKINGIEVVSAQEFAMGETDFRTMISKAEEKHPDAYLLLAFSPEIELLAKQTKELDIKQPISAIESFELSQTPELFEGYWYINSADSTTIFRNMYKERYDINPISGAANEYDNFNLIAKAFESAGKNIAGKPNPEDVIAELSNIKNYSGAVGVISVDEKGIFHSSPVVREIINGEFVTIKG